jgi:ribosome biogenesis GTPase
MPETERDAVTTRDDASDVVVEGADGVVVRAGRGLYTVHTDGGRILPCRLRGNLKKTLTYSKSGSQHRHVERVRKLRETDPVAVGDRVEIVIDETGRTGIINVVAPRRAALTRRSGNERERQTLVANLELAVIVFAVSEPRVDPWKLDRFLVLAEDAELESLIVLNKADKPTEPGIEPIDTVIESYRRIGYNVVLTSAQSGIGIDELRTRLRGRISAFCGPSGVGKSSLLNAIQPGLALKTGDVGGFTNQGRHTTVQAELLALRGGGWVADTPGLRQVEFWDLPVEDVGFCFPEIATLMGKCRFADCRHRTEPGCAVRAAIDSGAIEQRRYESYLEMTKGPS